MFFPKMHRKRCKKAHFTRFYTVFAFSTCQLRNIYPLPYDHCSILLGRRLKKERPLRIKPMVKNLKPAHASRRNTAPEKQAVRRSLLNEHSGIKDALDKSQSALWAKKISLLAFVSQQGCLLIQVSGSP